MVEQNYVSYFHKPHTQSLSVGVELGYPLSIFLKYIKWSYQFHCLPVPVGHSTLNAENVTLHKPQGCLLFALPMAIIAVVLEHKYIHWSFVIHYRNSIWKSIVVDKIELYCRTVTTLYLCTNARAFDWNVWTALYFIPVVL